MATLPVDARGRKALAIAIGFNTVAVISVLGRCIARFWMVRTCGADDILILFAVAVAISFTALIQAQNEHGLGRHFDTLPQIEQGQVVKLLWASIIVYNIGIALIKSSILCQFQRFFVGSTVRRLGWGLLVLVVSFSICSIFGAVFSCIPVAYFWDRSIPGGHCLNRLAFWFFGAGFNIVSDIAIVILPMPVLKSLHLPKKQKYSLILVFAVGGFGCITSIIRLHSLYVVAHSTDYTWDNVGAAAWSAIELSTGITCSCLPTLKPVINYFFPKLLLSRRPITGQTRTNTQHSILRDTKIVQHTVPRNSPGGLEPGLRQGFPLSKLNWKDEDKVYLKPENDEYSSSSDLDDRKSGVALNT